MLSRDLKALEGYLNGILFSECRAPTKREAIYVANRLFSLAVDAEHLERQPVPAHARLVALPEGVVDLAGERRRRMGRGTGAPAPRPGGDAA